MHKATPHYIHAHPSIERSRRCLRDDRAFDPRPAIRYLRSMKTLIFSGVIGCLIAASTFVACADESKAKKETIIEVMEKAPEQPTAPVKKTDEEWKKELTPEQYRILREDGTERANGDVYKEFKNQGAGTYYCAGCNAELFTSNEKFDSKCG